MHTNVLLKSLGRVKKETCLASGFLKKKEGGGAFYFLFSISRWPPFFFKCQISVVFSTAQTDETFWKRRSDKTFRLFSWDRLNNKYKLELNCICAQNNNKKNFHKNKSCFAALRYETAKKNLKRSGRGRLTCFIFHSA